MSSRMDFLDSEGEVEGPVAAVLAVEVELF